MTVLRVESLRYAFVSIDDNHDFSVAAPWDGTLGDFVCRLEDGHLDVRPIGAYPDERSARIAFEPHLAAWVLRSELEAGLRIDFRFSSAQVVETQGTGSGQLHAVMAAEMAMAGELTAIVQHAAFPPPSTRPLAGSQLVNELVAWIRAFRQRQMPMLVFAYLVLTRLEFEYGGRDDVSAALNTSGQILRTLGRLAAKNDPSERRKVKGPIDPLSAVERQWLDSALPKLALQAAEAAAGSTPRRLTMGELPSL